MFLAACGRYTCRESFSSTSASQHPDEWCFVKSHAFKYVILLSDESTFITIVREHNMNMCV